jgi:hypothetical protein
MILLPLTLAAVTAGCSTFSDSDVVARVNDVELTNDEFDARLTELGVTDTDVVQLEPVRAELTRWIQEQLVPADEIAAIYNAGADEAGLVCVGAIVVADQEAADAALADIDSGTDFVEVFQRENLDQNLVQTNGAIPCLSASDLADNAGTPFVDLAGTLSPDNPTGKAPLTDATGAEVAWVVLQFRSWDELDSAQAEQAAGLVDVAQIAADADVYVASRYGTFDAATGTVVSLG